MKRVLGLILVAALSVGVTLASMSFISDQREAINRKVGKANQRVKQLEDFIREKGLTPPKEKGRSEAQAPSPAPAPAPVNPAGKPKPEPDPRPDPKPEPKPEPEPSPSPQDCLPVLGCDPLPI